MKRLVVFIIFALLLSSESRGDTPMELSVTIASTASSQLELARNLSLRVASAINEEERHRLTIEAIASFQAVVRYWPQESSAVVAAGLAQGDLWLSLRAGQNAVDVLERLIPIVKNHESYAPLYRRLGKAYEILNRADDAAMAFDRAAADASLATNPLLALAVYRDAARMYERAGRPRTAAVRYRALAANQRISPTSRALAAIDAANAGMVAGDRAAARRDVAEGKRLVAEARRKDPKVALQQLEDELHRLERDLD
ncbi:MAG TPA: hypothetical protein VF701_19025 [Thermoanaerobaculia bacterium]